MGFIRHQYGPFHTVVRALSERRMGFIPGRPRIIRPDGLFFGTPAARIMPVGALLSTSELQVLRIFELYAVIVSSCLFLRCPRQ